MKKTAPKILFSAYAFYPEFGGLEQQIYLLSQEYLKMGYQVDVLTEKTAPDLLDFEDIDGINVYRMPYFAKRTAFSYLALLFHLLSFQVRKGREYQLVILRAALTYYPLIFGLGKFLRLIRGNTFVTADTGGDQDEIIIVKNWPLYKLMIFFFNQHNILNSVCEANYQHYLELGFSTKKLTKIGNGTDTSNYKKSTYPKKVKNFLFLARLVKLKGIYETIEAFQIIIQSHPSVRLYIGGDGPELQSILDLIHKKSLAQNIIYVGKVTPEKKDSFFTLGECLIQPSYSEGFGLVYIEAAVRKKVIIATDVADLKKIFGRQIFFCEKKNVENIVETVQKVLETKKFALNYDAIVSQFEIQKTAKEILKASNIH